jgi:hypothetical protein
MRKTISIILAIVLLAGSIFLAKYLINNKEKPRSQVYKIVKTVFTEEVLNKSTPIIITTNGNLEAKNKIEIYSEVQGIFEITPKVFKEGISYKKGEVIVRINGDEHYTNLQAQKSNLYNSITSIMPDIRLDYPETYNKWQKYLENFDFDKSTPPLPDVESEKEKFFISGRNIYTAYYNVKNMEVRMEKYTIRAPFNGVLTEVLVDPGTLVRQGQKLGEFIDPTVYEIGVSIKSEYSDLLRVGKLVKLNNLQKTKSWTGKVVRINGKVNSSTQTIQVYIEVKGKDLKEGEYLEVALEAKNEENAFEVSRKLIVENTKLYIVRDTLLELITIDPVYSNENSVIVKGLPDGVRILSKPVPGAHSGMLVKEFKENGKR